MVEKYEKGFRLTYDLQVTGWNQEDDTRVLHLPPVRIRAVDNGKQIAFGKGKLVLGAASV